MFKLTKAQIEANRLLGSSAKHVLLFGGSRSGKTFLLVRALVIRALKAPRTRHIIFRLHLNHIRASIYQDTLPKVLSLCFPDLPVTWNTQEMSVKFHNGSMIMLGGLDDKQRVEKILGLEFSTIYFNESSQIPYQSVQVAMTRLAQKSSLTNKLYYDANPPSTSHWLYKLFIKHQNPVDNKEVKNPDAYVTMRINPQDNVENISSDYIETTLKSLSSREQERFLYGNWTSDNPGALWTRDVIDRSRLLNSKGFSYDRIVVGVDPAVSSNASSDLTGISVCGSLPTGHYHVLADLSLKGTVQDWGNAVVSAYHTFKADRVVAEVNQGGDLVENLIRQIDRNVPYKGVHATRGKAVRAEPISALYEQGRVHHIGALESLEEEMLSWNPSDTAVKSPDRVDALVWALTELIGAPAAGRFVIQGVERR